MKIIRNTARRRGRWNWILHKTFREERRSHQRKRNQREIQFGNVYTYIVYTKTYKWKTNNVNLFQVSKKNQKNGILFISSPQNVMKQGCKHWKYTYNYRDLRLKIKHIEIKKIWWKKINIVHKYYASQYQIIPTCFPKHI